MRERHEGVPISYMDAQVKGGYGALSARSAAGIVTMLAKNLWNEEARLPCPREGIGVELGPTLAVVREPRKYLGLIEGRKLNPWTSLCEFPWMMAGRADVEWLLPYMPRAGDYSDDGEVWRGAYGPRLRALGREGRGNLDQLAGALELLEADPGSRQAAMTIWDPHEDLGTDSKDIPCANWLHLIREGPELGRLSLSVAVRSNDLIWGFSGVNAPNWCLLLQLAANLLGCAPGHYRHFAANLHLYDRHLDMLQNIATRAEDSEYERPGAAFEWGPSPGAPLRGELSPGRGLEEWTKAAREAVDFVETYRSHHDAMANVATGTSPSKDPWLTQWTWMMLLYHAWTPERDTEWEELVTRRLPTDWALAARQYWTRKREGGAGR